MIYLKHPIAGNQHVATEAEAEKLVADGWVRWPRSKEQKALDPTVAAAAARKKYEEDQAELAKLRSEQGKGKSKQADV